MTVLLYLIIILFAIIPLFSSSKLNLDLKSEENTVNQFRPRIGPMASMNFLSMDYFSHIDYSRKIRMEYPEKFRGFSFGVMSEVAIPKHEHMFSILFDVSIEYMPTLQIERHIVDGSSYEIHNEFTNILASLNGGIMFRVVETGLKIGTGFGLNYVYSENNSFVTLDSIVREEIANKQLTVVEYKKDNKTAEVKSLYDFNPKPIRIPVYFLFGYEFQGNKFSLFPYFRFNYSIFAQGSFSSLDYTVTAYQAGISLMFPMKK